ncbi:TPA: hypothetical protein ACH3X2_004645 [Trebouxia sp. C0005]
MGIPIPKIDIKTGGVFGLAAVVVGGGIQHVRHLTADAARSQAEVRALKIQLVQHRQHAQGLEAGIQKLQNSEAAALQRAAVADSSNAQLTLEAQQHQRIAQELRDSRDAAAVSHQQALQTLRDAKDLAEDRAEEQRDNLMQQLAASQAECSKTLEQAQLLHDSVVQGLQRQLHDALEGRSAAEGVAGELQGQLAAQQEAFRAVSVDLAGAQKDREEVVQHNCELQRANATIGDQVRQVQKEQVESMARFEAQSAELASAKAEFAAQAADKRQAVDDLQEQVGRLQEQEEAAARLQKEVDVLQQQLSTEHDLMVEAQITISTTQERGRRLLERAETAEGQVHHLQSEKYNLSTELADIEQQLPALQTQLQSAAGGEQAARATAVGLGSQVKTLQGAAAELKRQLEQQSSQLTSQAAELGDTRLKLQESQVACKALEKAQGKELQAAVAARQLAEDNLEDTTEKLAATEKMLKAVTKKKDAGSSRKSELQQQKSDLEERVQGLDEQLEAALIQLKEETGQNRYLSHQLEVLKTRLVSAGLEPACLEQADDSQDALSLPEVNTTTSHGGQTDDDVMSPQSWGSALGSPHIGAGWGHLTAGASCSHDEQSIEAQCEDASGMKDAASSADAGGVADASSTADGVEGGDGGVKEGGWEEVKRTATKPKGKLLRNKSKQGSRSNAGRYVNRSKSKLGNASNVLEVPRPRAQ